MTTFLLTGIFMLLIGNVIGDVLIVTSREAREPIGPPIIYR